MLIRYVISTLVFGCLLLSSAVRSELRIEITHREESLKNELIRLASKSLITKKDKESIRNIL